MKRWILRRILLLVFVLWGITTFVFGIMYIIPRNPAVAMSGSWATPEQVEKFEERWKLNEPMWKRYISFYFNLVQGDLGVSIRTEKPVVEEVASKLPATFELAVCGILISFFVGLPLGIFSAIKRNGVYDQIVRVVSLIGVSVPNFWFGLLLLLIFYYILGWAGIGRITSSDLIPAQITGLYILDSILTLNGKALLDSTKHIILPSLSLGFFGIGIVTRMARSTMLDVLQQDYITMARAKGLSQNQVIFRHAVRNALIPVITVVGVLFGSYLAGAIVVETIYGWPGLGRLTYVSIIKADQPMILGVTVTIAFLYSLTNFIVDILYRFLDPRIKF